MKYIIPITFFLLSGCTQYVAAERDLVTQTRRALDLAKAANVERATIVERYHTLQRQQLDEAFDTDVRERTTLDATWIIESRRAYATALDALNQQHRASDQATANSLSNLDSADAALQKLDWLLSLQTNWLDNPQQETK